MGQSTSFNYGLGYEVDYDGSFTEEERDEMDLEEYLYSLAIGEDYETFSGNDGYDTPVESCYLVSGETLLQGVNLEEVKQGLLDEMKRHRLEPVGEFSVVGDINTY